MIEINVAAAGGGDTGQMTPAASEGKGEWSGLFRAGALTALASFVLLPIQIGFYVVWPPILAVEPLFDMLANNWFRGLVGLDVFMLLNSALNLIVFSAVAAALWPVNRPAVLLASAFLLVSTATHFSSSTALELLDLSRQYAAASDPEVRRQLLAAGRFALAGFQGTAFDLYYMLSALMLLTFGRVMLQSRHFGRLPGALAIASGALMLVPATAGQIGVVLSLLSLLPWFALLLMLWRRLWRLAGRPQAITAGGLTMA